MMVQMYYKYTGYTGHAEFDLLYKVNSSGKVWDSTMNVIASEALGGIEMTNLISGLQDATVQNLRLNSPLVYRVSLSRPFPVTDTLNAIRKFVFCIPSDSVAFRWEVLYHYTSNPSIDFKMDGGISPLGNTLLPLDLSKGSYTESGKCSPFSFSDSEGTYTLSVIKK
jgi:hypothetical protein